MVLYSLDKLPPFEGTDLVVYSGILDFAIIQDDGETAVDLYTQDIQTSMAHRIPLFLPALTLGRNSKIQSIMETEALVFCA